MQPSTLPPPHSTPRNFLCLVHAAAAVSFGVPCHHLATAACRLLGRVNCYFADGIAPFLGLEVAGLVPAPFPASTILAASTRSHPHSFHCVLVWPLFDLVISKCTLSQHKKELSAHSKDLCALPKNGAASSMLQPGNFLFHVLSAHF